MFDPMYDSESERLRGVPIPARCYSTIVADPPWPYEAPGKYGNTLEHSPNRDKTIAKEGAGSRARYGAMSIDDICALPVESVAAENAHLYLWTTNQFLVEAHSVARAWGFRQSTVITWVKTRHADGQPSMKMGYYYRSATEHCLFCVRGRLRLRGPARATAFLAPRGPHSKKPEAFFDMVEEQSPGQYLELFARQRRLGWDVWGNQAPGAIDLFKTLAAE